MYNYDFDLTCRALNHYAKKFENFSQDEKELFKLGNGFLEQDLKDNSAKITDLCQKIKNVKSMNMIHDNQKLVDVSFAVYLEDLKKGKESLMENLKAKKMTEYSLDNINEEISKVSDNIK